MFELMVFVSIMVGCIVTGIILRKMYFKRDCENEMIAGVCAGLAKTMDIQPFWVRLGFLLTVIIFGWSLFLYLVLWITLPEE